MLMIHQVLAKPFQFDRHHNQRNMSLEDQLRSPCGNGTVSKEDITRANVKSILNVIEQQAAIAKGYAENDIIKYVSESHT